MAGYASLNRAALHVLAPGGLLVTASCSARVSPEMFHDAVKEAAFKTQIDLQTRRGPAPAARPPGGAAVPRGAIPQVRRLPAPVLASTDGPAGQYLERPALIDAGGATLEGLFHRGDRPPAVLLCPPLDAEGMDAPLLAEVAWVAARAGHASLRFQHRGRGASQGVFDPGGAVGDALSVLAHLRETAGPLAGSAGAARGLRDGGRGGAPCRAAPRRPGRAGGGRAGAPATWRRW